MSPPSPARQIVALGGGGFSEEPDNPLLDDFLLGLSGAPRPRICFVPTASGDAEGYIEKFYAAFPADHADASHLTLFGDPGVGDLTAFLLSRDVIYVGGGSTANMLATWRLHGVDRMLREAWESGVILAGISAGMICWFEASVTDSFGRGLSPFHDGLGLLPGSACPHYDSEPNRRPTYQQLIGEGALPGGIAADDGAAVHFVGAEVVEAVSSRPNACAYRVELRHGRVLEHPLETRYLDASPP